jgi:hypothetical protein
MLEQARADLENLLVDHFVGGFLVVHLLIECLDGISELVSLKIIVQEYILELIDHSIKDGNSDLSWLNIRVKWLLQVWMSHFETLIH